jgi:hypothetical protein
MPAVAASAAASSTPVATPPPAPPVTDRTLDEELSFYHDEEELIAYGTVLDATAFVSSPAGAQATASPAVSLLAAPTAQLAVQRIIGYALRVVAAHAHRCLAISRDEERRALASNMLALLDALCSPTFVTSPGSAPSAAHISGALAAGTLHSAAALPIFAPSSTTRATHVALTPVVAPSALGASISRRRTRDPRQSTAPSLDGVLAPCAAAIVFASALAECVAARCSATQLAVANDRFHVQLVNAMLADIALHQLFNAAVASCMPAPALPSAEFSLAATTAAVHCIVVRQFVRSLVCAWLRRSEATSVQSTLALRSSLHATPASTPAPSTQQPTTIAHTLAPSSSTRAPAAASSSHNLSQLAAQSQQSRSNFSTAAPIKRSRSSTSKSGRKKQGTIKK